MEHVRRKPVALRELCAFSKSKRDETSISAELARQTCRLIARREFFEFCEFRIHVIPRVTLRGVYHDLRRKHAGIIETSRHDYRKSRIDREFPQYGRSAFRAEAAAHRLPTGASHLMKFQFACHAYVFFLEPQGIGVSRPGRALTVPALALTLKLRIGHDRIAHGTAGAAAAEFRGHGVLSMAAWEIRTRPHAAPDRFAEIVAVFRLPGRGTFGNEVEDVPNGAKVVAGRK